jgi:3-oxoacyl-[acyl-carrier protein] reductase
MDLGIKGKWALVCGASKGLGLGCAQALAADGVNLVINARGAEALESAAARLRAITGAGTVLAVPCDITSEQGRAAVFGVQAALAASSTSSSPMPAVRRPVISVIGNAMPGSRRWMPTCSRRSG